MILVGLILAIGLLLGWISYTLYRAKYTPRSKEGFQATTSPIDYTSGIETSITNANLKRSVNPLDQKYCKTLLSTETTLQADINGYRARGETENQKAHEQMLRQVQAQITAIGTCRQLKTNGTLDTNGVAVPEPLSNISEADLKILNDLVVRRV